MNQKKELEYQKWLTETIAELKKQHQELVMTYEDARSEWMNSDVKNHDAAYEKYCKIQRDLNDISTKIDHLQEEADGAKYAIYRVGTDRYCYEILEKKSKSTFVVRRMDCKYINGEEKFYPIEGLPTIEIHRKRNLKGFTLQGMYFYLSTEPVEYLDPTF